jgi:hypothetical protein
MTNMTGSKLSIFSHPGKITGYWITTRSFPYRGPYWPGPIWAYDCKKIIEVIIAFIEYFITQYMGISILGWL